MDATDHLFPVCRLMDTGQMRFYYPYGNTPAEDFLENVHPNSVKKPDILVLGCGDIRSCFYTLWKHFSPTRDTNDAAPSFSGVHFVLNDRSPAVLARDIIFLYLCLQKPSNIHSTEFIQWFCAIWAIWFSKNLHPDHEKVLDSALRNLLCCSENTKLWGSKENQLNSLVHFSSEYTLSKIHDTWNMWLTHSYVLDNKPDHLKNHLRSTSQNTDIDNLIGMAISSGLSPDEREKMKSEISSCTCGNSFAEYVVGNGKVFTAKKLVANVTMYEQRDDKYFMHSLLPFRCFYHAFQFSPSQLKTIGSTILDQLIVADEKFHECPLLANSVQQLALWLSCTSIFNPSTRVSQCVKFTFHCSDALQFCNELQNRDGSSLYPSRFDVIYTSNLLDPLKPPNVVLFAMPLLKADSYLFTTTMKYKLLAQSTHDYITKSFGIDNKMLPVLFGIRCLNHEGDEYRSEVSILPVPIETNSICPKFTPYYPKVLVWEKVPSMMIQCIPPNSNLWIVLYNSISAILSVPLDSQDNSSSSQTAVKMLQTFLAHVNADDSDGKFWDPLCSLLKCNPFCKHLLQALQTHSILNGVHLHLLVTDKTCPICNKIPMSKFFGQISVSMPPLTHSNTTYVYARVYKIEKTFQYSTFDCFTSQQGSSFFKLCFIVPLYLCESNYYVSIVRYREGTDVPDTLTTGQLKSFMCSNITYSFSKAKASEHGGLGVLSTTLGSLQRHFGDGDTFESTIELSEAGYGAYLSSKKIRHEKLSASKIRLSCGIHRFNLLYPHPIDIGNLSVEISQSHKILTIVATRKSHEFQDEEAPLFLVYPDCKVTLPQLNMNEFVLGNLLGMQYKTFELALNINSKADPCFPPLTILKQYIYTLMEETRTYYTYANPDESVFVMIIVINRVYNYQVKAPAIDLIYGVTTDNSVIRKWIEFTSNPFQLRIMHSAIELMDKVFRYFSRRTISSSPLKSLLKIKRKVDGCFKRAVVYPLYTDPDDKVNDMKVALNTLNLSEELKKEGEKYSCNYCGCMFMDLFRCEQCLAVQFCGKCKRQHFSEHKVSCNAKKSDRVKPLSSATLSSSPQPAAATKCNFCLKQSPKFLKCSNCRSVQYCSQKCQKQHWKEHKTQCQYAPNVYPKIHHAPSDTHIDKELESSSQDMNKCARCYQTSPTLKACSNCLSVKYCSKECQRKHWSEHKMVCKQQSEVLNKFSACSYCFKKSGSLKKCTLCHAAQYCDKECQTKHWKIHKLQCKSEPVDLSTSPSKSANTELEHESQKCSFCSKQAKELKKCTRCNNTQYCDRNCQQKHWASHKNTCKPVSSKN